MVEHLKVHGINLARTPLRSERVKLNLEKERFGEFCRRRKRKCSTGNMLAPSSCPECLAGRRGVRAAESRTNGRGQPTPPNPSKEGSQTRRGNLCSLDTTGKNFKLTRRGHIECGEAGRCSSGSCATDRLRVFPGPDDGPLVGGARCCGKVIVEGNGVTAGIETRAKVHVDECPRRAGMPGKKVSPVGGKRGWVSTMTGPLSVQANDFRRPSKAQQNMSTMRPFCGGAPQFAPLTG